VSASARPSSTESDFWKPFKNDFYSSESNSEKLPASTQLKSNRS
jgi:hypothetical protein